MADQDVDVLLIGGGIASATAAATLRDEGFGGSVLLVGREPLAPYHRPPCSKGYLGGSETTADVLVHPVGWWDVNDVELRQRTSVTALDTGARTATLSTRETVGYDRALLATGANVRRLSVDGAQLEGIHYLRALANADAIRADIEPLERVVCVGGSYIGCEVAATLTTLGKRVSVVMIEDEPLSNGFGETAGRYIRGVLEGHGVEVIGGAEVASFTGGGRVERVVCADGRSVDAEAVVCGVGAVPDLMLARKAGLEIGEHGGVRCDRGLRTSAEGVWAAGDICEHDSVVHGRVLRIEHEEVAAAQGRTAARNMLGAGSDHDEVPYFFSDLADWASLEYVGPASDWDDEQVEGSVDDGEFAVWYRENGRVRAMLSFNGAGDLDRARELIVSGERG